MILKRKNVVIVGLARTGIGLAKYLVSRGAIVTISDLKNKTELVKPLEALKGVKKIKYEFGKHSMKLFTSADLIIVSPGVPVTIAALEKAKDKGVPMMSELEFTAQHAKQPIIAVTGTNGKTTATLLIGQMLRAAKKSAFVGGNIGTALVNVLTAKEKYKYIVAEVSSFQLELINTFAPKISAILNITYDHIDRHTTFDAYRAAKFRIFENQKASDQLLVNANDLALGEVSAKASTYFFKIGKLDPKQEGIYYEQGKFFVKTKKFGKERFSAEKMKIRGDHNRENMMVAIFIAKILKCKSTAIQETIDTFSGVPHRLEYVKTRGYVDFYNDSKATNVDAVKRALESFDKPLILIMGGRDKEAQFEDLRPIIQKKVKIMILMGEAKERLNRAIGDYTETFVVGTLEEAVFMAYQKSRAGDVILFSPGCASFDEFKDFEDRGDHFKDLLRDI